MEQAWRAAKRQLPEEDPYDFDDAMARGLLAPMMQIYGDDPEYVNIFRYSWSAMRTRFYIGGVVQEWYFRLKQPDLNVLTLQDNLTRMFEYQVQKSCNKKKNTAE